MNGAFYQEEVTNRSRFKDSGANEGKQQMFTEYVNKVSHIKKQLQRSKVAVDQLNTFCKSFTGEGNKERRAALISELQSKRYIDDASGLTYRQDMLGTNGILDLLNQLDDKIGKANDFVAGLGSVGTSFIGALDIYIGKAQNEAVEQEQIDSLKHIRRKGDFILTVASKTEELQQMSNQVTLKIQSVHKQTQDNNKKRYEAIKACLATLKDIDALESTSITATINSALKSANQIASANRVLNAANKDQLTRDKQQVVDDVTRSMEAHKKYAPSTKAIATMQREAPFLKNEES